MTDLVRVRHKISGQIAEVPENIVNHFVLGQYLEEVGPDAKPYLPEMHRVSLPENPTEDEIAIALNVGVISDDEAAEIRKRIATEAEADKNAAEAREEIAARPANAAEAKAINTKAEK